jgi:hypothetical protein
MDEGELTPDSELTAEERQFAKDEGEGVWRTVRGRKVFIRKGETAKQAVQRSLGKSAADKVAEPDSEDDEKRVTEYRKRMKEWNDKADADPEIKALKGELEKLANDSSLKGKERIAKENDVFQRIAKAEAKHGPRPNFEHKPSDLKLDRDGARAARKERNLSEDEDDMSLKLFANTIKGVEIFAPGVHNGDSYTEHDLDQIVASAKDLDFKPAVKLGHTKDKPGDPAYGYVENIRKEDGKLKADFTNVHDDVFDAIRKKMYDRVSSEIFLNLKRGGKVFGRALKAVALLGSEIPAVAGLKPLSTLEFADEHEAVKCFELKLEIPAAALADTLAARLDGLKQTLKEFSMDPKKVQEELDATKALVTELSTKLKADETKKQLAAANAKVAELSAQRQADAVKAKVNAIIIPAFRPAFEALYAHAVASEGVKVKVFSADGKESKEQTLVETLDACVNSINDTGNRLKSLMALSGQTVREEGATVDFGGDAGAELDAKTKKFQAEHKVKDYSEAMSKVLESDPELAARYRASHLTEQ